MFNCNKCATIFKNRETVSKCKYCRIEYICNEMRINALRKQNDTGILTHIATERKLYENPEKQKNKMITGNLFEDVVVDGPTIKYMVSCDTYDNDAYCLILSRKIGENIEILLTKRHLIRNESDKEKFNTDVNKLAEFFDCEISS